MDLCKDKYDNVKHMISSSNDDVRRYHGMTERIKAVSVIKTVAVIVNIT